MRMRAVRVIVTGVAAVVAVALALPAPPASAAGVVTHAWMAEEAVALVGDPGLAALLRAHLDQVHAGASFPDGGYTTRDAGVPGGDFGEEAHWHRFHQAYLDVLRAKRTCGDLTRVDGPCAPQVAHLMGVAAHGLGDEVWDWLFEPAAADHGELWIPPELADRIKPGGIEVQMDAVAITDHGRGGGPSAPEPSPEDLLAAFDAAGRPGITPEALARGRQAMDEIRGLEVAAAPAYRDALHANMPWTSANLVTAPGGIRDAARAIAAVYETLWARLRGEDPPTRVGLTAPADGTLDVPARGWDRELRPGANANGGGARYRIAAVLSWGLPYVMPGSPPGTHIDAARHPNAMKLIERDSGREVPLRSGFPRIVPYDPDYGGHVVALQPAGDLSPCTWYRAMTTGRLRDAGDRPVRPAAWSFRTDGCPDPAPAPSMPLAPAPVPARPHYTG
jgi:hypothetical protein